MHIKFGLKILIIVLLTGFLLIPLAMVQGVIHERSGHLRQVEYDIASTWTASQSIIGPVLSLPYRIRYEKRRWNEADKRYDIEEKFRWQTAYFMPEQLDISGNVATEKRFRGIYSVPVFTGTFDISGAFSIEKINAFRKNVEAFVDWGRPELSLAVQDNRGVGARPVLNWNDASIDFDAGSRIPNLGEGLHAGLPLIGNSDTLRFSTTLELRGSKSLSISPVARDASATLMSTWPHPKFGGRYLPAKHNISDDGFDAQWRMSSLSTGIRQTLDACVKGDCNGLRANTFSVEFIETVDIYQKVTRATKYGVLFVVLTFVAFFLSESLSAAKLHPVHYTLVGFSLCVFYLLLISMSEHVGFTSAYALATLGCCTLIGVYLKAVLKSIRQGLSYSAGIAALYGMLFMILRSEDFALLMGTLLVFAMLAVVMMLTRNVDWHAIGKNAESLPGGKEA